MADFDCIVVGAGVAGIAAAMKMAKNGVNVLLVDRGKPIGSKNLSGGVLWGHDLDEVYPDWWKDGLAAGAVERPITTKGINFLTRESAFTTQFNTQSWREEPYNAFTVLRSKFDPWLAAKAAEMGVMVVDGVKVDKIALEERDHQTWAVGVEQAGDKLSADCIVLADGVNSRLGIDLGIRPKLDRTHYVLGVKEVIQFPSAEALADRFALGENEGAAHEYVLGYLENGAKAGGFLYTNRDTISLGVVVNLDSIWERGVYTHKIMEDFRLHPSIKPLLRGGELVEYGAHLIPEGGLHCVPQLYGNGWCVIGDAAGFVYSNGLVIHGMNYAIKSGLLAADAVLEAKKAGDYSQASMSHYKQLIDDSFIMKDLQKFHKMHEFVWDPTIHNIVPGLVEGIFKDLFTANSQPKEFTEKILFKNLADVPKLQLAKTALKARRSV